MTEKMSERLNVPAPLDLIRAIDDWRRRQSEIPPRAEAVRLLLEQALKAEGLWPAKKPQP